jgi:hypothetical protein
LRSCAALFWPRNRVTAQPRKPSYVTPKIIFLVLGARLISGTVNGRMPAICSTTCCADIIAPSCQPGRVEDLVADDVEVAVGGEEAFVGVGMRGGIRRPVRPAAALIRNVVPRDRQTLVFRDDRAILELGVETRGLFTRASRRRSVRDSAPNASACGG